MLSHLIDEEEYEKIKRHTDNRWHWAKFVHNRACLRPVAQFENS